MERLQSRSEMYMDLMNLVVEHKKCDQVRATCTGTHGHYSVCFLTLKKALETLLGTGAGQSCGLNVSNMVVASLIIIMSLSRLLELYLGW